VAAELRRHRHDDDDDAMSRVALWFACALLLLAACSRSEDDAPRATPQPTPELIARGQYLATAGNCAGCHTARGGTALAGGRALPTPFGTFYATNLTPHAQHGIGTWSADDFWRAMHDGRDKDGAFLYPVFPFTNYTKVTRADSDAIHAWLMSLPPAATPNRPHALRFPYDQRWLLALWRALYFERGVHADDTTQSAAWNRGAYLVEGLGHCNACHGTRNVLGAVTGDGGGASGGLIPMQNWYAPSLGSSREAGLGEWTQEEIVALLHTGLSPRGAATGPMAAVVQSSLQHLSVADVNAMATYLEAHSRPQAEEPWRAPRGVAPQEVDALMQSGAAIYRDRCASCHGSEGRGAPGAVPPLARNQAVRLANPVNAIRIVLNGGFPPSTHGNPRPYGMPPFYQVLSDDEVAAVVTYIRRSWGNAASPVWSVDVQRSRGVPAD
jgi:mono/diheme cytochrome c family protein